MMDAEAIRTLLGGLSRPHSSGGVVVERAAILASGADSAAILAWVVAHDGQPEAQAPAALRRGLHGRRLTDGDGTSPRAPQRYVFPAGMLS